MKKRLKIAHIHVWDKKNKGDLGIVLAVQDILKKHFQGACFFDFPVETLKKADKKIIDKINKQDLLIIGGGGILYRYFLPFDKKIISSIKIPIVIFGIGYIRESGSKKLNEEEVKSIKLLVERANLVGVRDYYTKIFLIKSGIQKDKINLLGDPAVLLGEERPKNFKLKSGVKIGLNLNYSGWLGFGPREEDILKAYNEVAHYFQKKYDAQIYYLMHHPGEKNIIGKLDISNMKVVDLNAYEQKYIYGQLNLVIGMMLHSCVMAFGAGTPEINVVYDLRNKNFAKFIGCPELTVELSDLKSGELIKKAKMVFGKEVEYRKKFAKRKKEIIKMHEKYLQKIERLLNEQEKK
ncbi:MAG: polysaccharide pyruvyl transferase family protein [bacterium]